MDDWMLEKLMTFDAEAADLEDGGDDEPDADDDKDGPPVVIDLVGPKVIAQGRPLRASLQRPDTRRGAGSRRIAALEP